MFGLPVGLGSWASRGLRYLQLSIVMCVLLSVLDGVLRGPLRAEALAGPFWILADTWAVDFRYVFEQGILASVILFVGARIFETRSMISIGYDAADASKLAVKGPDGDHVVWIGRRYGSAYEAEVVATAFAERIAAGEKVG